VGGGVAIEVADVRRDLMLCGKCPSLKVTPSRRVRYIHSRYSYRLALDRKGVLIMSDNA